MKSQGVVIVTLDQERKLASEFATKMQALICASNPERVSDPYRLGDEAEYCRDGEAKRI